jgi:hypothetical protein
LSEAKDLKTDVDAVEMLHFVLGGIAWFDLFEDVSACREGNVEIYHSNPRKA